MKSASFHRVGGKTSGNSDRLCFWTMIVSSLNIIRMHFFVHFFYLAFIKGLPDFCLAYYLLYVGWAFNHFTTYKLILFIVHRRVGNCMYCNWRLFFDLCSYITLIECFMIFVAFSSVLLLVWKVALDCG